MWSYTYVFSLVLVLHSYFWLFIQTRYLEHCPFISKKNVLFPIISCTPHLSSQRSSQGEIWSHIFSGFGIVPNYIFKLFTSEIKCDSRKVDMEDICHCFSMVYNLFLTVFSKMGIEFHICGDMLLPSSEGLPKVTLWIWMSMFQLCVPETHFLLNFGHFPKLHLNEILILC